ncbi:MAG: hypothetical protein ACFE9C_16650 [Candidatus Hodarchaeota archaeon]
MLLNNVNPTTCNVLRGHGVVKKLKDFCHPHMKHRTHHWDTLIPDPYIDPLTAYQLRSNAFLIVFSLNTFNEGAIILLVKEKVSDAHIYVSLPKLWCAIRSSSGF